MKTEPKVATVYIVC